MDRGGGHDARLGQRQVLCREVLGDDLADARRDLGARGGVVAIPLQQRFLTVLQNSVFKFLRKKKTKYEITIIISDLLVIGGGNQSTLQKPSLNTKSLATFSQATAGIRT